MLSEIARTFVGAMYILGAVINLPYLTPKYIKNLPNSHSLLFINHCETQS